MFEERVCCDWIFLIVRIDRGDVGPSAEVARLICDWEGLENDIVRGNYFLSSRRGEASFWAKFKNQAKDRVRGSWWLRSFGMAGGFVSPEVDKDE